MTSRRGIAWLLALLVVLATVGGGAAVLWVAGTQSGTAWVVNRLLAGAPQVTIAGMRGTLLEGLVLEGVRLRTERDELDIDSLTLDWRPAALLGGTLAFDRAAAARATYRRVPGVAASGSGPPELPWPVRLEQASVATLSVTVAERTVLALDTRFAATYGGGRLELERVTTGLDVFALEGDASFELRGGIELDIAGRWSGPIAGVAANGTATLAGTWPQLRLHHELAAPFMATTDGTVALDGPPNVDLVTEWQALAWPNVTAIASPSGRLALTGTVADYRYDGAGMVETLGRTADFAVTGSGARLELAVGELALTPTPAAAPGGATLRASGPVSLANRTAELAVVASGFDPSWLVAAWPGRLDGTTKLRAALAPQPNAAFDAIDLAGTLRNYPVTLRGAATLPEPGRFVLDALRLESDANYAVLTGTLDRTSLDLAVEAELEQVDLLVPNVGGALAASLTVDGTWREPRARGSLTGSGIAFAGITLERLDLRGEAGLAPDARLALTVDVARATRDPVSIGSVSAALNGTTAAHTVSVDAGTGDLRATVSATGAAEGTSWRGTIERLDVDEPRLGPWHLDVPAALAFGRGFVTLANSCLLHTSQARWCTQLDVRGRREDNLVVSGQNFDLATLRPLLPPALELDGVYQLSGALLDLMGEPRGAIALVSNDTRARIEFGDSQAFVTELDRVQAGLTLTDGRLELTAAVRNTTGGRAEAVATIADTRERDSPIDGWLHVEWPDLAVLTLLSPQLSEAGGALAADLTVGGTVAEPTVDGRAVVTNGRVVVPQWGLVVERIEATASSSDGRALDIDATGYAGEGALRLEGTTQLDPEAGWPTRLTLRGDAVRVVQRTDAEIVATPDLQVEVALPAITVSGSVHVPRAAVTIDALPAQAVTPSPDAVVHGGDERDTRRRPLEVRSSVQLTLGEDVRYSGLNLDTTVGGELRLTTEPNRSANATGTLRLAGTYDAYGQRLELERGQLLFSGPLDDPGLDVRAVRKLEANAATAATPQATEVGIELTGTLRNPRTRIVATPAMSEADALSYLLFGRPASGGESGLGSEETSALQTAALSLGLQQALPVVQRLGNSLGLDELTVRSTTTDAGELMAGKYLSPKVYIRYSYGLFNRIGGLLLRFKINERLSIETRSGDQKSMDLLYTVEKN
jgi:translocation and assembly module TamB